MNIFVASLPYSVDDNGLRNLFEPFGKITSCKVIFDRDRNQSKCFGFVEMEDEEAAKTAISELNDKSLEGRNIVVKVASDRPQRSEGRY